jgi:hypothetical protein
MTLKHIFSTIATALGLGGLAASAFAHSQRNAVPPTTTPIDPESSVMLSSYVQKNGVCYRVDLLASGASRSTVVDDSFCAAPPDL